MEIELLQKQLEALKELVAIQEKTIAALKVQPVQTIYQYIQVPYYVQPYYYPNYWGTYGYQGIQQQQGGALQGQQFAAQGATLVGQAGAMGQGCNNASGGVLTAYVGGMDLGQGHAS